MVTSLMHSRRHIIYIMRGKTYYALLLLGVLNGARINLSVVDGETITMYATDADGAAASDWPTTTQDEAAPDIPPTSSDITQKTDAPNPPSESEKSSVNESSGKDSNQSSTNATSSSSGSSAGASSTTPTISALNKPQDSKNQTLGDLAENQTGSQNKTGPFIPGICPLNQDDPRLELGKSTWWHCDGSAISCFAKLMNDTHTNLANPNCTNATCFTPHVPTNIKVLADLADKYWPKERDQAGRSPETTTISFTPFMELLANLIIQKSRWCRVDMDAVAHLSNLVALSQPCCGNSTVTASMNSTKTEQSVKVWTSVSTQVQTFSSSWVVTG